MRLKAKYQWLFWRPVVLGVLTYTEARDMQIYELIECNEAIELYHPYIDRGEN